MDGVEPTKRQGRVTTQQSDCLGDFLLQFMSPPAHPGEGARRSQCKVKASYASIGHISYSHSIGTMPFHVTMKLN